MSQQAKEHYDRYVQNVALAQRIEGLGDEDWSCVARFYAALHLMTAYLVLKSNVSFDPASAEHSQRKKAMDHCPELKDSRTEYRKLKDLSESVRYDPGFVFGSQHLAASKAHLVRVVAIVEAKVK